MDRTRRRRSIRGFVIGISVLAVGGTMTVPVVAQSGGMSSTPAIHSFRSFVHIVGIVTSGVLAYYAYRARRQFQGGVFATSALYVLVGALVFALAFVNLELEHQFGFVVVDALKTQGRLAVRMGLFSVTVFAFGTAMYLLSGTLQEWELT